MGKAGSDQGLHCLPRRDKFFIVTKKLSFMFFVSCVYMSLRKHAYSNILKISPPKTKSFQIKILILFSYFCSKHRLWVLVRTASARRF